MKALAKSFETYFEWRLLPVWVSFAFLSGWLGFLTIMFFSETGVDPAEVESLTAMLPWLPWFFIAIPFIAAASGVVLDWVLEVTT